MREKLVSIIVPCYKQAEYLAETLESVLAQTYQNWECVVVNDGSPDNTDEIANRYVAKDNRFKYVWQENGGPSRARNAGIANSTGDYVLPLDADDLISPGYVEKAVDSLSRFPEIKLVYSKVDMFGSENGLLKLEEYDYEKFIWKNCIVCTAMFRRADYDQTNGYNENMVHGDEDWDFWLSLLKKDDDVYRIDEVLFHYRIKDKSRTTDLKQGHLDETWIQLCKNHPEVYAPYYNQIIIFHNKMEEGLKIVEENLFLKNELDRVHSSHAYRIGKFILKPFSWLRNRLCFP